jgi:basic membrane lipoprotein Med (substrate-binding protein (PBP1-ABC) superfamily)
VFAVAKQEQQGQFKGGTDLVFNLKNGGMGIGKINPSVPASYIKLMQSYKAKIIAGTLKVPSALK